MTFERLEKIAGLKSHAIVHALHTYHKKKHPPKPEIKPKKKPKKELKIIKGLPKHSEGNADFPLLEKQAGIFRAIGRGGKRALKKLTDVSMKPPSPMDPESLSIITRQNLALFTKRYGTLAKRSEAIMEFPLLEKVAARKKTHPVSEAQRRWAFAAEERGELPRGKALKWSRRVEGKDLPAKTSADITLEAFQDELAKMADETPNIPEHKEAEGRSKLVSKLKGSKSKGAQALLKSIKGSGEAGSGGIKKTASIKSKLLAGGVGAAVASPLVAAGYFTHKARKDPRYIETRKKDTASKMAAIAVKHSREGKAGTLTQKQAYNRLLKAMG